MRAHGSTLGELRDWSPSPTWPEGRGLMLFRPLLRERRESLRTWLRARRMDWVEDPANHDERFLRARARAAIQILLPEGEGGARSVEPRGRRRGGAARHLGPVTSRPPSRFAAGPLPLPSGEGTFAVDRTVNGRTLSAALVCAGGGSRLPDQARVEGLAVRLAAGARFSATLAGARLEAGDEVLITREPGEYVRRPSPPLPLQPNTPTAWDGRFEIAVDEPGWSVLPADGRLKRLPEAQRALLAALPPAARAALPVLIRDEGGAPVLASSAAEVRCLVPERFRLALGMVTHEADLGSAAHGAPPPDRLSCLRQTRDRPAAAGASRT